MASHFPVMALCFFVLPKVLLMFINKFASCSILYFNSNLFSIENSLALALNSFKNKLNYDKQYDTSKEKKKIKLA